MRMKTEAKRQVILEAAGAVFQEHGFSGASMAAVAERVGGSKATLYRYFSSKEELFLAIMLDPALDPANALTDDLSPGKDVRRALERFGVSYLTFILSKESLSVRRLMIAECLRHGAGLTLWERGPKAIWTRMACFLAEEMAAGRLREQDPWMVAMHLRGMLEADLVTRSLLGADVDDRPANVRRHVADAVEALLRAYGPPPELG